MKHAYLILAHNEFEVLQLLIQAIDDVKNDIYIHFDKKMNCLPSLSVKYSNLFILHERIDVGWGDVSMIKAELLLFEKALNNGSYIYYHLLSGVDMPIKPQKEIHSFFEKNNGKEFIGFNSTISDKEVNYRVKRTHLFPKNFRDRTGISNVCRRILRYSFLKFQYVLGITRNKKIEFKKGTQWISVTHDFVKYLVSQKNEILEIYKNSFCSDELFVQTLCWNSPFRKNIYNLNNEGIGSQRKIGWRNGELVNFEAKDFEEIMQSNLIFARKFSSKNIDVVKKILWSVTH